VLPDPSAKATLAELARWTIVRFCVGEACAIQQLVAMRDAVEEANLRPALTYMLRDEVHHARFGWALAESIVPALERDELEWIGAALAHTFAFYESLHGVEAVDSSGSFGPRRSSNVISRPSFRKTATSFPSSMSAWVIVSPSCVATGSSFEGSAASPAAPHPTPHASARTMTAKEVRRPEPEAC
jgi:hypothetical protein